MNVDNMTKLADLLDRLPAKKFNMEYWTSEIIGDTHSGNVTYYCNNEYIDYYDCKTAGCIAGWVLALKNDLRAFDVPVSIATLKGDACEFLGLTYEQGDKLFLMSEDTVWYDIHFSDFDIFYDDDGKLTADLITNDMAVKVLRNIISGEVDLDNLDLFYKDHDDDEEGYESYE